MATIPPKYCTYACRYCQVGRTTRHTAAPRSFWTPERVLEAVARKLQELGPQGEGVDYISLVPDGEPTLDLDLDLCIRRLRSLGLPLAVITNGSLLSRPEVRLALAQADWVSVKVDSAREESWRLINRPHRALKLADILDGVLLFRHAYRGHLVTESMLVADHNDTDADATALAAYLGRLKPAVAYVAVPTRPPAVVGIRPAAESCVARLHELLASRGQTVELLTGSEGDAFASTGNAAEDILAITSVHPMRRSSVEALLKRARAGWDAVQSLLQDGRLVEASFAGQTYYVRSFVRRDPR